MLRWEADLNCTISVESWSNMIDNLRKSTCAAAYRESPLKLLTRWYMTPSKIHSFYPTSPSGCFRGCPEEGDFLHIFWSCKHLDQVWSPMVTRLESVLKKRITLSPQICLLFDTVPDIPLPCNGLIHSLISSIHWMIAFNWRSQNLPWSQVESRMEMIRLSERIHYTLFDRMQKFNEKWSYWSTPSIHPR